MLREGVGFCQDAFMLGYCEIDDVLNNTIGTALGAWFINKYEKRLEELDRKFKK